MSGYDRETHGSRDADVGSRTADAISRHAQLVGVRGTTRSFPIDPVRGAGVGGDPNADDADFFVIRSPGVAPYHCKLQLREGRWRLLPRGGVTRLNGLGVDRETTVLAGDRIQVGSTVELRFEFDGPNPETLLNARFDGAAATDAGLQPTNEDAHVVDRALCAVADGIGGGSQGELASTLALQVLKDRFASPNRDALSAARAASQTIWEMARRAAASHGMGTTLTAAALEVANSATVLHIVHAGDSRAYVMRSDGLRRVTSDHRSRSDGRALSRALGLDPEVDFDWHEISAVPGDRIVLVTDGVSDVLNDDAIARLTAAGSPTVSARRLVRAALRDHSRDNVTAVVADVVPTGMRVIAPGRRPRQVEPPEEQAAVPGAAQEAITRPLPARHRTSPLGGYRLGSVRSLAAVLWLLLLLLFVAACAVTVAELVWVMTSDLGATAIATIGWTGFAWLWARARQPALVLRAPWWWRRPRRPQDQFREWR